MCKFLQSPTIVGVRNTGSEDFDMNTFTGRL